MSSLSTKCSTVVSVLALASLPSDDVLRDAPLKHPDFKTSSGHIRRVINGTVCHGVDWDGTPGIDSILREQGRRSGPLWREFRERIAGTQERDLRNIGEMACSLLLKHFGPYHHATSEALQQRRLLEKERNEISRKLDAEFSPSLRQAAREYLAPQLAYALKTPPLTSFIAASLPSPEGDPLPNSLSTPTAETHELSSYAHSAKLLQEHVMKDAPFTYGADLEQAAKEILRRAEPLEINLDVLDVKLSLSRLPIIPGEEQPTDMDRLAYGSLICRHRAVIVGLLLADAGYDIRIVEGTLSRGSGFSGGHLFLYSPSEGILEPSADGPHFWQKTIVAKHQDKNLLILVEGDLTYNFKRQIPLGNPQ
jgi:hypothetical protein